MMRALAVKEEAKADRGRLVELAQLRTAIWQMERSASLGEVLNYVQQVMCSLHLPFDDCAVYLVKAEESRQAVFLHDMTRDGEWQFEVPPDTARQVKRVWKAGIPNYRPTPTSVLEIPFSHGAVRLSAVRPGSFDEDQIELATELASVISCLFHRVDDLAEIEARDAHMREMQNVALVGQLAAGAAHEINNALTAVLGYSELLLREDLAPNVHEGVQVVNKAARQVQSIAKVLLNLSRRQATEMDLLDLNELIVEMTQLIQRQLESEEIEFELKLDPALARVNGHASQIQQVL